MTIMKMLRKLDEIEQDCLQLQKKKGLSEYGKGQLDLIRILRREQKKKPRSRR